MAIVNALVPSRFWFGASPLALVTDGNSDHFPPGLSVQPMWPRAAFHFKGTCVRGQCHHSRSPQAASLEARDGLLEQVPGGVGHFLFSPRSRGPAGTAAGDSGAHASRQCFTR